MKTNDNIHLKDIDNDITSIETSLDKKKALRHFLEANPDIFTNSVSISTYSDEIIIWNPLKCLEQIVKSWGQQEWKRVPDGETCINWVRTIDGFKIVLRNMEQCEPTLVPLTAWPILIENSF